MQYQGSNVEASSDQPAVGHGVRAVITDNIPTAGTSQASDEPRVTSRSWLDTSAATELAERQGHDLDIGAILAAKVAGRKPLPEDMVAASPATRHYWVIWDSIEVYNGVLYKHFKKLNDTGEFYQVLVPREMKPDVMKTDARLRLIRAPGCQENQGEGVTTLLLVQRQARHNSLCQRL